MYGNVAEWCLGTGYTYQGIDLIDPTGPAFWENMDPGIVYRRGGYLSYNN